MKFNIRICQAIEIHRFQTLPEMKYFIDSTSKWNTATPNLFFKTIPEFTIYMYVFKKKYFCLYCELLTMFLPISNWKYCFRFYLEKLKRDTLGINKKYANTECCKKI